MTPFFGRKKEPKEVFEENMKKAKKLWESRRALRSSEYKKLLKYVKKAQETAETVEVDQGEIVRLWGMKGSAYLMGYHRLDEALECYDKALSINPINPHSLANKLQVLGRMEKWDEIIKDCDKALELISQERDARARDQIESIINEIYARAWVSKGIPLGRSGKPEEAMECFDKAVKINPKDARAWVNKGVVLDKLGKPEEVMKCYDRALKIYPGNPLIWYKKGVALGELGKPEEAIECYDRALKIDPRGFPAWVDKGLALITLGGKPEEAMKCFDRALKINPRYARAWYEKGVALNSMGRHGEAEECFRKADKIDPSLRNRIKSLSR
ncbi:MAG: tetratricopeptide repeat protein, partial [Candidatus Hodarchaeota archaeon]